MKVTALPFDPGPPVWKILSGDSYEFPSLAEDISVDVAVVGAGFAGMSAARQVRLLEPKIRIAVLEARGICEGSCGRNSGFMIDLPHNLGANDYVGQLETDRRQIALNREGIEFARQAAADYLMPQEAFEMAGKVNAAATETGLRHNEEYAAHLKRLNEPYEALSESQMHEISGSVYYLGGLATPGNGLIKPGMYFAHFARGLGRDDVAIYENSPIIQMEKNGINWKLKAPNGSVEASKVILAVNGHVESFGYYTRRLMHLYLYGSITRRLAPEEVKKLGGLPSWGFTPAAALGSTVRRISGTGGDRILIRNGVSWAQQRMVSAERPRSIMRAHDRSFRRRFPQLSGVDMEYRWGGLLCLSRNSAPAFGELEPGLYSACCQNGLGVCQGTLHGKMIAQLVCGAPSESLDQIRLQPMPAKLPPEPFFSVGAYAATHWGEMRAGKER